MRVLPKHWLLKHAGLPPLPDTAPARSDPDKEHTPPRGQGAPTTRAPLLPTQAVDREDIRTERRRRDSGSEERRTLRWNRTPSPQDEARHSFSPIRYDTERPLSPRYTRFHDLPAHLRTGSRERATDAAPDIFAESRDRPNHTQRSLYDGQGRTSPPTLLDTSRRSRTSPNGFTEGMSRTNTNI